MGMLRRHREAAAGFKPPAPPPPTTIPRGEHERIVQELTRAYERKLGALQAEFVKYDKVARKLAAKCAKLEAQLGKSDEGESSETEDRPSQKGKAPAARRSKRSKSSG